MITLCHPNDNLEQMFIVSALEAAGIPYFILGEYFGGIYPGVQIAWYNERTIKVPAPFIESARQLVEEVRADYVSPADDLTVPSKFRMLAEAIIFGWFIPGGKKKGG